MAGALAKIPVIRQNSDDINKFLDGTSTFVDAFFGLLEDGDGSLVSDCDVNGTDDDENPCNVEGNKAFWETQEQLLQGTLCRTTSLEAKIRQATKEALKEANLVGVQCICRRPAAGGCRSCMRREISIRLQKAGYDCAICNSKWRSSSEIPSGEHTYLEVVDRLSSKKGEIRVVIELNFRAEFEMARASQDYNHLVSRLPEVFVGKAERLKALIKILCAAAKKCMKEKKMHMGPWRKHKYVLAKWFSPCQRTAPGPLPVGYSVRLAKSRASMLTFDLVENLPGMHCPAVAVV